MPKADLIKIYEAYRQANLLTEQDDRAPEGNASTVNMGPDGQYPELPAKDENAEEGQDWKVSITKDIVESGSDFLKNVYQLGYTGEAGEQDVNEIVALLAQEVEADARLEQALKAVITHMVNAGQADH